MNTIAIQTGRPYQVMVGQNLLNQAGALTASVKSPCKACIVTDSNVAPLYSKTVQDSLAAAGFDCLIYTIPAGEPSKCHPVLLKLYEFLSQNGVTRSDLLVALGGGVVGDLTGFAAATFLRGLEFVQIPTTLLAQIDSSVGGKTGVNIDAGKNLVGAFYQPLLVLCDTDALSTLPAREFACGMAEAIKYGCIKSEPLFSLLEQTDVRAPENHDALLLMIEQCIRIKAQVVANDEREKGERMLLNFGHTLGHTLENYYHYKKYNHGEAVAIGMCMIARLSAAQAVIGGKDAARIEALCSQYSLPIEDGAPLPELLRIALSDKKRHGDTLNLVWLARIGEAFVRPVNITELGSLFGLRDGEV